MPAAYSSAKKAASKAEHEAWKQTLPPGALKGLNLTEVIGTRSYADVIRRGKKLTKKEVVQLQQDVKLLAPFQSQRLDAFETQANSMQAAFDEARTAREAARKRMEEQHADVLQRISDTRQMTMSRFQGLHADVAMFHTKFERGIDDALRGFKQIVQVSRETTQGEVNGLSGSIGQQEQGLVDEREERIRETEEKTSRLRSALQDLEDNLRREREEREEFDGRKDGRFSRSLAKSMAALQKRLATEKEARSTAYKDLLRSFRREHAQLLEKQVKADASVWGQQKGLAGAIAHEATERSDHQGILVGNLSNFLQELEADLQQEHAKPEGNERRKSVTVQVRVEPLDG